MRIFSNLSLVTKLFLVGFATSALLAIGIAFYFIAMRSDMSRLEEYRSRYIALSVQFNQLYAQSLQTEQATRNVLLNSKDQQAAENFRKAGENVDILLVRNKELAKVTPLASQLDGIGNTWNASMNLKRKVIQLAKQGNVKEATTLLVDQETPIWREFKKALNAISEDLDKIISAKTKEMDAARSRTFQLIMVILVAAALTTFTGIALIAAELRKRLGVILENLRDIAYGEGDLTRRVPVTSKDELGQMAELFNEAWDKLDRITREVIEKATCTEAYSGQLEIESVSIMRSSRAVAMQTTAVATASEEMSATADDIARSCTVAAEAAANANEAATEGATILMESVNVMNTIADKVREAAHTVTGLGSRSDQIGAIVETIQDIADQTNLLALNAAIEAARAGEQGRGFAVVADEVRALAERTTRATREIGEMIKNIQLETREAVSIMEEGASEVDRGISESARSCEALNLILEQISSLTMQVSQIATAAEEQSATTTEIVGNISAITTTAEDFNRTTLLMDTKAAQIKGAAEDLKRTASVFKTHPSKLLMLDTAKLDHVAFVHRIENCLENRERIQASSLPDHTNCRFGKWYFSEGKELCCSSKSFQTINEPHERIHRIAKEAVDMHNKGDSVGAGRLLHQVEQISVEIVDHLEAVKRECINN